jgi:hypothetical protein
MLALQAFLLMWVWKEAKNFDHTESRHSLELFLRGPLGVGL